MNPNDYKNYSFMQWQPLNNTGYLRSMYRLEEFLFKYNDEYKAHLLTKYQNICNREIEDGDTIFLNPDCHFPKSLVSRNKIPIKLQDNGAKIVYNFSPYLILYRIKNIRKVKVLKFDNNLAIVCEMINSEESIKSYVSHRWEGVSFLSQEIGYLPLDEILDIYPDNSVSFYKFVKYINSKLAKPSKEEKESIIGMMDSNQDYQNKLAFDILKNYDNSFALAHILNSSYKDYSKKVTGGVSYKYIRSVIGVSKRDLLYKFSWNNNHIFPVCDLYLSGLSPECKNIIDDVMIHSKFIADKNKIESYCKVLENDA